MSARTTLFRGRIEILGVNPYVLVDAERAGRLKPDWRKPMPVLVQVDGAPEPPWRINLMPRGDGAFYLYLHGVVRKASKTRVGDEVAVALRFDEDYAGGPASPLPAWFAGALAREAAASEGWERLPPSRRKEIVRYFVALKSEAARERNLVRAIAVLSGARARFMGRSWNESGGS
ncbi:MAG: DUF1905 domain-containing protein [Hyphomicrobiales bacterium]|nr:YdeI/OmpD-associated family protein [Hyphomicrobiales bacterium]MDE2018293.1 DUF1905 domain-containing protein [Hyphomicrobiales bacterium]